MKKSLLFTTLVILISFTLRSQTKILTTAEKSNYQSTSTYADVMSFIGTLQKTTDLMRTDTLAISTEGRVIPLLIIGNPLPSDHSDLKDDDRVVVYIQANIHAGEVEGKEATQMLIRDLVQGKNQNILKDVVLLVCPILNPDGNEKFSKQNRTNQNGPANGVGVRHNGQRLDLNRDAMKLETPEIRGVVTNILNKWDPAVSVDCHTTNGSYHEEPVTFTWMINPNGDRNLINYMRDEMAPSVSNTLLKKYKVENVFYGEFLDRKDIEKGWISYASEPRYIWNYIGLRNRLSILNENYVYADFKTRTNGCYNLLWSILEFSSEHKDEIKQLITDADARTIKRGLEPAVTDSFAIEYKGYPTPDKVTIKAYDYVKYTDDKGRERYKKGDNWREVTVPYIADYFATKSTRFPFAYILSISDEKVVKTLETHGIIVEKLSTDIIIDVEIFKIEELKPSNRLNQGHYTENIQGEYINESKEFAEGTYIIRTGQQLGCLVAYLLEPKADDGFLFWNFFDKYLAPQWGRRYYPYPVYRVINSINIETTVAN